MTTETEFSVTALLDELRPDLHRTRVTGLVGLVATVVATGVIASALWSSGPDLSQFALVVVILGVVGAITIWTGVRRSHEKRIMPAIARSIGFHYDPDPGHFRDMIPPRLLPRAGVRKVEDLIEGEVAGRKVQMAEAKYETGGKNSSVLFRGIVARVPNAVPMPAFFLAPEAQTRGLFGFAGRIRVDDLVAYGARERGGTTYGIWVSPTAAKEPHPALHSVLDALMDCDRHLSGEMSLFSASNDGAVTHVALSCPRNLFMIGGLLRSEDALLSDIRKAAEDLSIPLNIVTALLAAEERAVRPAG